MATSRTRILGNRGAQQNRYEGPVASRGSGIRGARQYLRSFNHGPENRAKRSARIGIVAGWTAVERLASKYGG